MPNRKKHHAVAGVFQTRERADRAVEELKAAGFTDAEIGMVYRDGEGGTVKTGAAADTMAEEGATAGAVAGAVGGAAVGAGIIAGVIPVIGPVLALGTLGTILANAAGGAAIAGLAGALIGWGIPEDDAAYYEEQVAGGRYLVTVDTADRQPEARSILQRGGGFDRTGWEAVRAYRDTAIEDGAIHTDDGRVLQLKEEHLKTHKQSVATGDVKVRKEVHTDHKQLTIPVEREEVVIERRPAGGRASGDMKAEEIRIPTREEKVTVTKEAVVKEEVAVGKRKVRDTQTVSGDVRREELVVEPGGAKVRQTRKTSKK